MRRGSNRCNNRLQDFRCNSPMTCSSAGRCGYLPRPEDPGDPAWVRVDSSNMVEINGVFVSQNVANDARNAGMLILAASRTKRLRRAR